ncbi:NADH-FMN oxidoreductase RutF, flavin reductase (DIM6/NTAB) family [Nocardioides scoriae]|uniref:NADH-FMN oxidoreductase RutF, flavin reductase (DIM6/NTAB) family n=1 Tax=Nocardioides scoriae TaxID=642780 RepID=A0A1H1TXI9_9ACTN|nr:flavin reductase family protein [Nocardioides scoriae]SDS64940.1 NADH-FMN oxidoreductase RutF, flavin reductase (DIM6/NTAB) family [Nocardioides scoriae]
MTDDRTVFDPSDEDVNAYKLLNSLVVPRPIAWVTTVDEQGRGNLAPHSFFTVASGRPPVVLFSSLGHKDTVTNIEQTGEFVVSVTSEELFEQVNASSAPFEHGDDEARALGIATELSATVRPERVAASPASIECRLERIVEVGHAFVVFGLVTAITVRTSALEDGVHPMFEHLRPVSRLGRDEWGRPPEVFRLTRPEKPEDVL